MVQLKVLVEKKDKRNFMTPIRDVLKKVKLWTLTDRRYPAV